MQKISFIFLIGGSFIYLAGILQNAYKSSLFQEQLRSEDMFGSLFNPIPVRLQSQLASKPAALLLPLG
jgi:hypothetical protein